MRPAISGVMLRGVGWPVMMSKEMLPSVKQKNRHEESPSFLVNTIKMVDLLLHWVCWVFSLIRSFFQIGIDIDHPRFLFETVQGSYKYVHGCAYRCSKFVWGDISPISRSRFGARDWIAFKSPNKDPKQPFQGPIYFHCSGISLRSVIYPHPMAPRLPKDSWSNANQKTRRWPLQHHWLSCYGTYLNKNPWEIL